MHRLTVCIHKVDLCTSVLVIPNFHSFIKSFVPNAPFLDPLKTENLKKTSIGNKWVNA